MYKKRPDMLDNRKTQGVDLTLGLQKRVKNMHKNRDGKFH